MAYIDTLLLAHRVLARQYSPEDGGPEAMKELAGLTRTAGPAADGGRPEPEEKGPVFWSRLRQVLAEERENPAPESLEQWDRALSRAVETGGKTPPVQTLAAAVSAAAEAAAAGSRAGGSPVPGDRQGALGGVTAPGQELEPNASMAEISRFFERDARRYGG